MRPLEKLALGFSVVFGVFLLALVAELCYLFYRKHSGFTKRRIADCRRTAPLSSAKRPTHSAQFARETSFVVSFDGFPGPAPPTELGASDTSSDGSLTDSVVQPPHSLFPIKEETKEDLELASSSGAPYPNAKLHSRTPRDVLTIHFTRGSSTPPASSNLFTTPPSSPLLRTLSPCDTCTVRTFSVHNPPPEICSPSAYCSSPIVSMRARTPLPFLFERSPLFGPRPLSPSLSSSFRYDQLLQSNDAGAAYDAHQAAGDKLPTAASVSTLL